MGWHITDTHDSHMIPAHQTQAALDSLYQLILTQSHIVEHKGQLHTTLERLCCMARFQDDSLPLACLPMWGFTAAGGDSPLRAVPVAAAWRSLHLAGKLLNDAASQTPSTLLPAKPSVELLNVGVSLIFLAQALLADTTGHEIPQVTALKLQREFAQAGLQATVGQHERLEKETSWSVADYQIIVAQRSGRPFALATRAGALLKQGECPNEDEHCVQALADYGYRLGMMIQLADDFNGVWRPRGRSDLAAGKRTWPLFYAQALADTNHYAELLTLAQNAPDDPEAEAAARDLLVQMGVPLAMLLESEKHHRLADKALASLDDSEGRQMLTALAQRASLAPKTIQQ